VHQWTYLGLLERRRPRVSRLLCGDAGAYYSGKVTRVNVQTVNGFFNVPIFTILFIGFVTKRVPPLAARVGLVFFIGCYAATQLFFDMGLHFLHVLFILFILTSALMLAIGKFFPMSEPYRQKTNNVVDIRPWRRRHIYAALLLVLMVLLFVVFSRAGLVKLT